MSTEVIYCHKWNYEPIHRSHKTLLYALQGNKCRRCWEEFPKEKLTIDHIKARTDGGKNQFMNKQLLCEICHNRKTTVETEQRCERWRQRRRASKEYKPINQDYLAARKLL